MEENEKKELLKFALNLAKQAGNMVIAARKNQIDENYKTNRDLVTESDIRVEQFIISSIKERFPEHRFLAEESITSLSSAELMDPLWIIDPIDGTTNFARGHNHLAVSIAFAHAGEVQVGVVHCPIQDETFSAAKNLGACLNDEAIQASSRSELESALICVGRPFDLDKHCETFLNRISAILKNCLDMRRIGAGAVDICWVACGRLDGFWETLNAWDIAAALLVAREAGATHGHLIEFPNDENILADLDGRELCVAAPALYEKLVHLLQV